MQQHQLTGATVSGGRVSSETHDPHEERGSVMSDVMLVTSLESHIGIGVPCNSSTHTSSLDVRSPRARSLAFYHLCRFETRSSSDF